MAHRNPLRALLYICLLLFTASPACAETAIKGEGGSASGNYVITASQLEGVLGIVFEVAYDPEALTLNKIDRGPDIGGATWRTSINNTEGTARIVIVNTTTPLPNGTLARLIFVPHRMQGIPIPTLRTEITNTKNVDPAPSPPPGAAAASAAGSAAVQTSQYQGGQQSSPMPEEVVPDEPLQPEPEPEFEAPAPIPPPQPARPAEPPRPQQPGQAAQPAAPGAAGAIPPVLERFRTYTGERTIEAFLALFNGVSVQGMKQEPAIGAADGVTPVTVTLRVSAKENVTPTFALHGARLVSLEGNDEGAWVLQVIPAEGKVYAIISALTDSGVFDFPLVIAPPVPAGVLKETPLTEDGFRKFVKETGTEAQPLHDVNGDGKRDYVDDYIFTANYARSRGKGAGK